MLNIQGIFSHSFSLPFMIIFVLWLVFFVQLIPVNVPSLLVLQIRYNCTRDGCTSSDVDKKLVEEPPNTNDPTIIVYRVNNVVRAVSAPSGVEKWNLSVHQYELCLLTGGIPTPTTAVQKTSPICNLPLGTPVSCLYTLSNTDIMEYLSIRMGLFYATFL